MTLPNHFYEKEQLAHLKAIFKKIDGYVFFDFAPPENATVEIYEKATLDGDFSAPELRAIADLMDRKVSLRPGQIFDGGGRNYTGKNRMPKTVDENWADWESYAFGYGYGTGEKFTILALKRFMELCHETTGYDYRILEKELTPVVAWLLINRLCQTGILEYGTSPRGAWLTKSGQALKKYMDTKTASALIAIVCEHFNDYSHCCPEVCHCGPGYVEGRKCQNPFWQDDD